jgi:membrane protein
MLEAGRLLTAYQRLVWETDTADLRWWQVAPIKAARLTHVLVRDLLDGRLTLHAMSLVFTTLLSIVPLLAVSFSVLKAFGVHNQLQPLLLHFLNPLGDEAARITNQIIGFVDNIKAGVLGALGIAFLFYTAITLIQKVEWAFNEIWHVDRARSLTQQFSSYFSVLMIVPVLVFSALGVTASLTSTTVVQTIVAVEPLGSLYQFATQLVPYLLIIAAFTFVYIFVPNTRVRLSAALTGGVVAGVLWQTTGWLFAKFIASSTSYAAIYSGFAILIVLMIWIYWNWLILLVGASIAFYQQHAEHLIAGQKEYQLSSRAQERLALTIMALIGQRWYQQHSPWTAEALVEHLHVPMQVIRDALAMLEAGGLVFRNTGSPPAWLPARPLDRTEVREVLELVRDACKGARIKTRETAQTQGVEAILEDIDRAIAEALDGRTLKDVVAPEPAADLSARLTGRGRIQQAP